MTVDPLTLAVVRGGLEEIVEEMDRVMARTAFSPVISEAFDRANGLYYADDGGVIVQGSTGLPIFIGVMQFAVRSIVDVAAREATVDGDVFIMNDPYAGGTHLMDIKLVKPIFHDGELVCFVANTGHWVDIGGSTSGGTGVRNTEIYQEGLQIPPVKIRASGQLNDAVVELILANVRRRRESKGDLASQFNALHVGEVRLHALIDQWGLAVVRQVFGELRERSAREISSYITEIPDGKYSFRDYLDDDGWSDDAVCVDLIIEVVGGEMTFDFRQSSTMCRGPLNVAPSVAISACLVAIKHIFPDAPINAGCLEPLTFLFPDNSFLNARPPAPVAAYNEVAQRVVDAVFGAIAQANSSLSFAASYGTVAQMAIGGTDLNGEPFVAYLFHGGGYGGSASSDGLVHGAFPIGIARLPSIEVLEQRFPIRMRRLSVREDSGGAGEFRGGCGTEYDYEFVGSEATLSILGDREKFAPFGIAGGLPAARLELLFGQQEDDELQFVRTKRDGIQLVAGSRIVVRTPGGGGYGDPLLRSREKCRDDALGGYVSEATLRNVYGFDKGQEEPDGIGPSSTPH